MTRVGLARFRAKPPESSNPAPQRLSFWSLSVITLRRLVLAASVLALLPAGAMAASTTSATTPTTHHHKKPVHHVSHKTHKPKTTSPTNTQS
jgi:hypothetical protein